MPITQAEAETRVLDFLRKHPGRSMGQADIGLACHFDPWTTRTLCDILIEKGEVEARHNNLGAFMCRIKEKE